MSAQWRPLSYDTQFMLSDPSIRVHAAGAKCDKNTDQLPRRTHQQQKAHAATTYEKAEWHQPDAWHEKRHDLRVHVHC